MTPLVEELVAVDGTGETNWPYGSEDLAGDGATFQQQERSVDIRTAYAATDAQRLWVRAYVADTASAGGNIEAYIFIDADDNSGTGGDAIATAISGQLSSDPSPGGYEYLIGIQGNSTVIGLWQWDGASWSEVVTTDAQISAEAGTDLDPIRLVTDEHGYLQVSVDLDLVGLTEACNANLFVRSVNDVLSASDVDVGSAGSCIPADSDSDGIPDIISRTGCDSDADCPGGGRCIDRACVYTEQCNTDTDCDTGEVCTDNLCVAGGGQNCSSNADCTNDLACVNSTCRACTSDAQCGSGRACAPDGRCVVGTPTGTDGDDGDTEGNGEVDPEAGEEAQGGACACSVPGTATGATLAWLVGIGLIAGMARRRRSQKSSR
jgi:MYXO-CTERM domain-containing protein